MTATTASKSSRAPLFIGAGLLVSLIVIGLVAGSGDSPQDGPPYSPSSTASDGTRGLVLLVREFGVDVRVGQRIPDADTNAALLLHDGLDDQGHTDLEAWVAAGGTLVVADPGSAFAARPADVLVAGPSDRGFCDIPGLEDVQELDVPAGAALRVGRSMQSCFGDGGIAFIVSRLVGAGHIITIGGPDVFTNGVLDSADNSVLAVRLLLPAEGGSVAVLDPNPPGSGRTTLGDLIADRVFQAILQLGVAFIIYALWRSRRVGRPVTEPQPVAIAGSQFVRAVGGLRQRSHATDRAASMLRVDTRRALSDRFGVPLNLDTATLAELTASRTGLDRTQVAAALSDAPILDEASLVTLGQQLDTIRQEVLDGRRR
ncbi:MAG: hypothetical protein QOD92_1708 [Acidimicrobiaceae bacterium]|jgi:hypothetical protein